jgi:hypothetical protein
VIGYGPQPRDTLRTIMQRCEFSLLGNHEHGAMFYASDFNPRARAAIDWTRDQLSRRDCPRDENMKFWNYLDQMKKEHREAQHAVRARLAARSGARVPGAARRDSTSRRWTSASPRWAMRSSASSATATCRASSCGRARS